MALWGLVGEAGAVREGGRVVVGGSLGIYFEGGAVWGVTF